MSNAAVPGALLALSGSQQVFGALEAEKQLRRSKKTHRQHLMVADTTWQMGPARVQLPVAVEFLLRTHHDYNHLLPSLVNQQAMNQHQRSPANRHL